jgi:hypothetical protein
MHRPPAAARVERCCGEILRQNVLGRPHADRDPSARAVCSVCALLKKMHLCRVCLN